MSVLRFEHENEVIDRANNTRLVWQQESLLKILAVRIELLISYRPAFVGPYEDFVVHGQCFGHLPHCMMSNNLIADTNQLVDNIPRYLRSAGGFGKVMGRVLEYGSR